MFPDLQLYIYADNFHITILDHSQLWEVLNTCIAFLKRWGLQVDLSKTYYWSTSHRTRSSLLANKPGEFQAVSCVMDIKDLGTHLAFDRRFHAKTVQDRTAEAYARLEVLGRSSLPRSAKVQAISQSIFPQVFFQPGLHKFSIKMMNTLSTAITDALGLNAHGRSKPLALALYPKADPFLFLHSSRIKHMRNFLLRHPSFADILNPAHNQPQSATVLFFESIKYFGWTHLGHTKFSFQHYQFDLLASNYENLLFFFKLHCSDHATTHTIEARHFDLPTGIDVHSSQQTLRPFSYQDTCLAQAIMTLKDTTGKSIKHWQPELVNCNKCGAIDSWEHRFLMCPYTQAHCPDLHLVKQMPMNDFSKLWGWRLYHPAYKDFLNYVSDISVSRPTFQIGKQCFFFSSKLNRMTTQPTST
jgi:hypothetical protein